MKEVRAIMYELYNSYMSVGEMYELYNSYITPRGGLAASGSGRR